MDFESEMIASFGPSIVECESESFSCDLDDIPDANGSNNASIKNFVPNDGDVLLGRGKSHNHHPGNILFKGTLFFYVLFSLSVVL